MSSNCKHTARVLGALLFVLGATSTVAQAQIQRTNLGFHPDRDGEFTSRFPPCLWEERTPSPITRFESASAVIDGCLYVLGGFKNQALQVSKRVDIYDPETDSWTQGTDMPTGVTHVGVATDGTDMWLAGGFEGDNPGAVVPDVWKYDTLADTWTAGLPLPFERGGGALVRVGRDLHYFGGVIFDRNTGSGDHWVLDLDGGGAWQPRAPLPGPRNHLSAVERGGRIYALGGQEGHDIDPVDVDWCHVYDPLADSWSPIANLPLPRSHFEPGTFLLRDWIVIAGGRSSVIGAPGLVDVTGYDPDTDTWLALPSLPEQLLAPTVRVIGGQMIAVGGGDNLVPLATARSRRAYIGVPGVLRVNAGGPSYVATNGFTWCPDQAFIDGQYFQNPNVGEIFGTDDDVLYRTERSGESQGPLDMTYRVPLPPGTYRVDLHFAEIFWGAPGGLPGGVGARVFDVYIEGEEVLSDYDIFAAVGAASVDVRSFTTAVPDGALDLRFVASVDRPKLSAFLIRRL